MFYFILIKPIVNSVSNEPQTLPTQSQIHPPTSDIHHCHHQKKPQICVVSTFQNLNRCLEKERRHGQWRRLEVAMVRLVICGDDRAAAAWRCGEEWVEHIFFKIICSCLEIFLTILEWYSKRFHFNIECFNLCLSITNI